MLQSEYLTLGARIFGDQISGNPCIFDFSSSNPNILRYDPKNFAEFQRVVFEELKESG